MYLIILLLLLVMRSSAQDEFYVRRGDNKGNDISRFSTPDVKLDESISRRRLWLFDWLFRSPSDQEENVISVTRNRYRNDDKVPLTSAQEDDDFDSKKETTKVRHKEKVAVAVRPIRAEGGGISNLAEGKRIALLQVHFEGNVGGESIEFLPIFRVIFHRHNF